MGEEGFDLRHCQKWMRSSARQQRFDELEIEYEALAVLWP